MNKLHSINNITAGVKNTFLITLLVFTMFMLGCSQNCDSAKAEASNLFSLYMKSMLEGKKGASVPGSEAPSALENAKKICNRPDLTFDIIMKEQNSK